MLPIGLIRYETRNRGRGLPFAAVDSGAVTPRARSEVEGASALLTFAGRYRFPGPEASGFGASGRVVTE